MGMKKVFERLMKAPLYLKIAAAVVAIVAALVIADFVPLYISGYILRMEDKYPWISGGTVVTYLDAPNGTLTLRVSPFQKVSIEQWVLVRMGIAGKGIMWNDGINQWKYLMNDYFYYEKTDDSSFIKSIKSFPRLWNLERPKVTGVVIDEGVTHIADKAFYRNTNFIGDRIPDPNMTLPVRYLESIVIANSVETIGKSAFEGCGSLPSLTIPNGVKKIGKRAFYDCDILSPVTIPKSVEYIGEQAFDGNVYIDVATDNPKYSSIDGVLFNKNKTELIQYTTYKKDTAYIIPDGVTKIGAYAFQYSKLKTITIPSSVDSIGIRAFVCSERDRDPLIVNSLTVLNPIPPTTAGASTFYEMYRNTCLYVPEGSENAYRFAAEWRGFKCIEAISAAGEDKQ